ncbi:phage portal protein [Crenalkalicoccus roseus]|uniref:phage portal protein n=1 Tax=Crenalkalicoccus roseus TaxID=1485588 RepID=UPI001F016898|nr:phage portal protein [Crenalkalicoccus roseus]
MSWARRIGAMLGGFGGWGTPGLEAGAAGRRLRKFRPPSAHVNTLIARSGRTVLERARYLVRNNPYAANAVDFFAAQVVGDGITPSWVGAPEELRRPLADAWLRWTDEADAEGLTDFYGLQRRAARELFIAGEVFLRLRPRRPEDGLSVPLQVQMLPAEMLPLDDNRVLPDGHEVRQGVEIDAIGRRLAYWFWRQHPDDDTAPRREPERTRVPADQVIHLVDPVEAGQVRGLSRLAPAIVPLWLLDLYDDAELDRKRTAALFAWFRLSPDGEPGLGETEGADGASDLELAPGAGIVLAPGEDVKFAEPTDVGGNYEAFQYRNLLRAAAGLGIPYVGLTGDMAQANYSSLRASLLDFRRRASAFQHGVLAFQMCRPVAWQWMDAAALVGAVPGLTPRRLLADVGMRRIEWRPPRWEWVDPLKDIRAEEMAVAAGFRSRSSVIEALGYDPAQVDDEIAAERAREQALGLIGMPTAFGPRAAAPAPPRAEEGDGDE